MKTLVAFASAAALLCTASIAQAQSAFEDPAPTVRVGYGDLDISRASGRAVLEQRIRQAIERVCPRRPLPSELGHYKLYRNCKEATWDGVKPQLAQIYSGRQLADLSVRIEVAAR